MASIETIEQVKERIEELDPAEAQEELKKGGVALIDTREPNEYMEAHIDGAELVRPSTSPSGSRRSSPTTPSA